MEAPDRRPIASRERRVFKAMASALVRARVSANAISVIGMIAGLASGVALALTPRCPAWERALWVAGAALVQLRLLANMLDGMVALESGRANPVGELYNEIPDRVSDTATLVGLGYAVGGHPVLGLAAALAAMFTAYVRATGRGAGAPSDFSGPMAKPHRMFLVTVTAIYLAAAPLSWRPQCPPHPSLGLAAATLGVVVLGSIVTALRRLVRIGRSLRGPRA